MADGNGRLIEKREQEIIRRTILMELVLMVMAALFFTFFLFCFILQINLDETKILAKAPALSNQPET